MIRVFKNTVLNIILLLLIIPQAFWAWVARIYPERTQTRLLRRYLKQNKNTKFGRYYKFERISNMAEYQAAVPLYNYDGFESHIGMIYGGHKAVLTAEKVLLLEPSSGSSSTNKFIPYTRRLKREFQRAVYAWVVNLLLHRRNLILGRSYWSITPASQMPFKNSGHVPIGFAADSEYFDGFPGIIIRKLMICPDFVSNIQNIDAWRYVTLLFLLKSRDLAFVSIWNPSFFPLLLSSLPQHWEELATDIACGTLNASLQIEPDIRNAIKVSLYPDLNRAKEIQKIFQLYRVGNQKHNHSFYERLWPNLMLISCWGDGSARDSLKELQLLFPHIEIQPKGLLATEGVISYPLLGFYGHALALTSHFFEFIEYSSMPYHDETKIVTASHLQKGKLYSVVITTGGGLYRYRLGDLIQVVGFHYNCPLIKFIGKEDKITDMRGEKISESFVISFLPDLLKSYGISSNFTMIAAENSNSSKEANIPYYALFLELNEHKEIDIVSLSQNLEDRLQKNYHYQYCRRLGQLGKSRIFLIDHSQYKTASEFYLERQYHQGQKIGDIKPSMLSTQPNWSKIFKGHFCL